MQDSYSPKSEDPDDNDRRDRAKTWLMATSAALDLVTVLVQHSQDGTPTSIQLAGVLAAATKVVIALTR